jgi:hypothetical protein
MTPQLFFKSFWVVGLIWTALNAVIYRVQANEDIRVHPERTEGYRRLIRGFVIWFSLPWIALGIMVISGALQSVEELFGTEQPAALLLQALAVGYWIMMIRWVFFEKGAETLERYPAMLRPGFRDAGMIKLWTALGIAGGCLGLITIWSGSIPQMGR